MIAKGSIINSNMVFEYTGFNLVISGVGGMVRREAGVKWHGLSFYWRKRTKKGNKAKQ